MKKTLLLSVVASSMIMAGGDIAPVEPVVETPAPVAEASGWDFGGNAVAFYQTRDNTNTDLFDSEDGTAGNLAAQLRATNKDLIGGIGAGLELSGLYTNDDIVAAPIQQAGTNNISAAVTQAYLTYGMGNTSLKVGRQHLPKALSPFAFTEGWQVIKNSFDAALVVNSDLPDTTLVYAFVDKSNQSFAGGVGGDIGSFNKIDHTVSLLAGPLNNSNHVADDGVHMVTAQNKSIDGLTLTGSYYFASEMVAGAEDASILWGDAKFKISDYAVAVQGGTVMGAEDAGAEDTTAFGAKIGGNFGMFNASLAYSSVDEGAVAVHNLGTQVKTPLYTQAILNQNFIKTDSDTFLVKAGMKALGGSLGAYYNYSDLGSFRTDSAKDDYSEFALTYKTKVTDNTTVWAGYVNSTLGDDDSRNFIRVWARYNFN